MLTASLWLCKFCLQFIQNGSPITHRNATVQSICEMFIFATLFVDILQGPLRREKIWLSWRNEGMVVEIKQTECNERRSKHYITKLRFKTNQCDSRRGFRRIENVCTPLCNTMWGVGWNLRKSTAHTTNWSAGENFQGYKNSVQSMMGQKKELSAKEWLCAKHKRVLKRISNNKRLCSSHGGVERRFSPSERP